MDLPENDEQEKAWQELEDRERAADSSQAAGSVFRDLALKVSNDISEDIDAGESREELREVVRWWAQKACDEAQRRATAEQTVFSMAKQLMDIALPPNVAQSARGM
ncbi:MAG: hypothetical protein M0R74_10615 [Dehalococcoidia bacterium]|jgi:hypothetical protein|nr:hypothetical protein [Dehalococcoidia bacterium]